MTGVDFLKKNPTGDGSRISRATDPRALERTGEEGWIVCRACSTRIARKEDILENASHAPLIFSNPHGHTFHLLLVTKTEAMIHDPVFTSEHTWFAGYAWSIGVCRSCRSHLGWQFRRARRGPSPAAFAALSLARVKLAGENM
jgi:hypothetical protein